MTILALEFSSSQRSVAVARGGSVLGEVIETGAALRSDQKGGTTGAFRMIEAALREAKSEREQILSAGLEEFLSPDGVTVIEWAEKIYDLRLAIGDLKKVQIEIVSETERKIVYDDFGA